MNFKRFTSAGLPLVTMLFVFALALSGCNTTQGFGEDVEAAGEGIQRIAD
ncbi:MAG: entericidin A/B family lipoprotein [Phycisphaerae bacterium]